jgi:conjugal transfer pilus assembly protein TraE
MKLDIFLAKNANTAAENKLLKFVVLVMAVTTLISIYYSHQALKLQKTVIIPPLVDKRIVISSLDANDDYIKLYSRYCFTLLLNYTPTGARQQYDELLTITSPEFYPKLKIKLDEILESVQSLQVVSLYYPQHLWIDREKKEITVRGLRKKYAHSTLIDEKQEDYVLGFKILNGRFYIDNLKEKIS